MCAGMLFHHLILAGITTFNALKNSGAKPGDVVIVSGIGGLGHLGTTLNISDN